MAFRSVSRLCGVLLALSLGGCADLLPDISVSGLVSGLSAPLVPPPVGSPPPPPISSLDPLSQFALTSSQGSEGTVALAGVAERARVIRAYNAASGRQCREILFGSGGGERAQLVCGDANGFQLATPLLRGAAR